MKTLAIIGAGAAGMFCAANLPRGYRAVIFEGGKSPMQKLLLTGGGRCNYTNLNIDTQKPENFYPRGARNLRKAFRRFGAKSTIDFFKALKIEPRDEGEGRIFPSVGDAQSIADGLRKAASMRGAELICDASVNGISQNGDGGFSLSILRGGSQKTFVADFVLFAGGGNWNVQLKESLEKMGHNFEPSAPSLYAFKIGGEDVLKNLSGLSVQDAKVFVELGADKFESRGALLITHFGFGGPAILKMSSFAARELAKVVHKFELLVDWIPSFDQKARADAFQKARADFSKREIKNAPIFGIPQKLWELIIERSGVASKTYSNLSKDDEKCICVQLTRGQFEVSGMSTHKAEFVTCGGVSRDVIDFNTMQSRIVSGLFFAGECVDIDAITGGFNLQAAWTSAKICAESLRNIRDLEKEK